MKAKSARAKGTRVEKEVAERLNKLSGVTCRRQPGSGIYSDFPHDCYLQVRDMRFILECKARKSGLKSIQGWLGKADILVMRPDRSEPYAVMPLHILEKILELE